MKLNRKLLFASLFVMPLFIVGVTVAHADDETTTTQTDTTTKTIEERIEARKKIYQAKLDAAQEIRLKKVCTASQARIKVVQKTSDKVDDRKGVVHGGIIKHLENLDERLEAAGIDTATYDQKLAELKTLVQKYETDFAAFKQALVDSAEMKCADDPSGFKASIEAAREKRKLVIQDGVAIRAYLKTEIKPLLVSIRAELKAKKAAGEGEQ